MRNVQASSAFRGGFSRGHTAVLAFFAALVSPIACFPLEDLSAYSQGSAGSAPAVSSGAPEEAEQPSQAGSSPSSSEGSPAGAGDELGLAPGTSLAPGATTGSDNGAGTACGADCVDAGSPSKPDASSPPRVDAGPDVGPLVPACAAGETKGPNGRCYVAVGALVTWADARGDCRARAAGWDLASIRSRADNDFVDAMIANEAWLGGTDAATEETWLWVSDGLVFWQGEGPAGTALNGAFDNWFDDEPNGSDGSDCMRMLSDGSWADLECSELRAYVCEGPPR